MAYVASLYTGGRVVAAVKANFLGPDETNLVVALADGINVYRIEEEEQDPDAMTDDEFDHASDTKPSLVLETSTSIYDIITTMEVYRPDSYDTDCLLISTSEFMFFSIRYDREKKVFVNEVVAKDVSQAHTEAADPPLVRKDPGGRMIGLYLHQGLVITLPLRRSKKGLKAVSLPLAGKLEDPVYLRFSQFQVLDMIFLYGCDQPTLAILCDGPQYRPLIYTYEVKVDNKGGWLNQEKLQLDYGKLGKNISMLIPVGEPYGGFIIAGAKRLAYKSPNLADNTLLYATLPEAFDLTAHAVMSSDRYIVGDRIGSIFEINLQTNGSRVTSLETRHLGATNIPCCLVPLPKQRIFVGSQMGDHQFVQRLSKKRAGLELEILQDLRSLCPIMDLAAPDLGYSNNKSRLQFSPDQTRLITASGFYHNGAFKTLRNGVRSETILEVELQGVQAVFPISDKRNNFEKYLILSFLDSTKAFEISEESFEEQESFFGFDLETATILSLRTRSGLVQVTSQGVSLVNERDGLLGQWKSPDNEPITFAAGNEDCLLVVVNGKTLVNLDLISSNQPLSIRKRRTFLQEISCLTVPQCDPDICIVGFWGASGLQILSSESFEIITNNTLSEGQHGAIPRSIILAPLINPEIPTLLVGMSDGTLYSFNIDPANNSLVNSTKIYLSDGPVSLFEIPRKDLLQGVFAAAGQSSIIYGSHGHLVYSMSMSKNARYVAPIRMKEQGNCVAVATLNGLNIEKFEAERSFYTASYNAGAVVRRMVHWKEKRVVAAVLAMIDVNPNTDQDLREGSLKIYDDAEFNVYDTFELKNDEIPETVALVKVIQREDEKELLAVGTSFLGTDGDVDSTRGRLLLFELVAHNKLRTVLEQDLGVGAVRSIQDMEGKLVVGARSEVRVYTVGESHVTKECSYTPYCQVMEINTLNRMLAVGDLMRGPALVEYLPEAERESKKKGLVEVAMTFLNFYTQSLQLLDESTIIAGDANRNLMVFRRPESTESLGEVPQLEVIAHIRLEQMVNRITRIYFPEPDSLHDIERDLFPIAPYAHLGTADGRIYIFALIKDKYISGLLELQEALATNLGVGGLSFNKYRGSEEDGKPFRFVDGDFLRSFSGGPEINTALEKIGEKNTKLIVKALEGLNRFMAE